MWTSSFYSHPSVLSGYATLLARTFGLGIPMKDLSATEWRFDPPVKSVWPPGVIDQTRRDNNNSGNSRNRVIKHSKVPHSLSRQTPASRMAEDVGNNSFFSSLSPLNLLLCFYSLRGGFNAAYNTNHRHHRVAYCPWEWLRHHHPPVAFGLPLHLLYTVL